MHMYVCILTESFSFQRIMLLLSWNSSSISTQNRQTCSQTHILLLAVNYTISIFATSTMLPALFSTCVCLTKKLPFLPFLIFNCFNGEQRRVRHTDIQTHTTYHNKTIHLPLFSLCLDFISSKYSTCSGIRFYPFHHFLTNLPTD